MLNAESSVSSEMIAFLLSLISIVLRFPIAAQWLSHEFFFLGAFSSPEIGVAAIPEVE